MRVAFVDHDYHLKTASSEFFTLLFVEQGVTVDRFWPDRSRADAVQQEQRLADGGYDAIVFWQEEPRGSLGKVIRDRNVTVVPMYDFVGTRSNLSWFLKHEPKYLCFSSTLHRRLTSAGLESRLYRYYPQPEIEPKFPVRGAKGFSVFFWSRVPSLNWQTVRALLSRWPLSRAIVHAAPDTGEPVGLPSGTDRDGYPVSVTRWFERRSDMVNLVRSCDVYVAPRLTEGIGMGFLEAMAMGKCVVAHNEPTMSEYLRAGASGVLADFRASTPIEPPPDVRSIGKAAYEETCRGYEQWSRAKNEIVDYVMSGVRRRQGSRVLSLGASLAGDLGRLGDRGFVRRLAGGAVRRFRP